MLIELLGQVVLDNFWSDFPYLSIISLFVHTSGGTNGDFSWLVMKNAVTLHQTKEQSVALRSLRIVFFISIVWLVIDFLHLVSFRLVNRV